ncbi:MAG: tetratricopeptide repeat-containing glycosyltransferase family protein [Candidatus Dependentiae bacterium]
MKYIFLLLCSFSFVCASIDIANLTCQGFAYIKQDDFERALPYYAQAVVHDPKNVHANYNIAYILLQLSLCDQAVHWYKKALECDPKHENALFGCAKALLTLGHYEKGLHFFEWRYGSVERIHKKYKLFELTPRSFEDKEVVLLSEWGMGDNIQCLRYVHDVKKAGAKKIVVQTHSSLQKLFSLCPYIDQVITMQDPIYSGAVCVPMFSLPRIFKTSVETIPNPMPYLFSDPTLDRHWHEQLKNDTNFKVGICWYSNKSNLQQNKYVQRCIPLEVFEPLTRIAGVSVYSLQKGDGQELLNKYDAHCPFKVIEGLDVDHGPFMDTVSVMKEMDLIISADTSIVHVAGAMYLPVWTLLPYSADWRWLQNRSDSPWYPSMRLFRQKEPNNWIQLMDEVVDCLKDMLLSN